MSFTADSLYFYHNQQPFVPVLEEAEKSNIAVISLPARLSDNLKWDREIAKAELLCDQGKFLLWEMDLGIASYVFAPNDSAAFYSFAIALEEFATSIYSRFKENTFGISLYRGECDFRGHVPLKQWEETFQQWILQLKAKAPKWSGLHTEMLTAHNHSLFGAQILAEYLQRLISVLPEDLLTLGFFDTSQERSLSEVAQKLSRARFESLQVMTKGFCREPATELGVCLPLDSYLDVSVRAQLDALFCELSQNNQMFRLIPEEKLTEEWNGLEELIILPETVSPQGKRKLLGFMASGGTLRAHGFLEVCHTEGALAGFLLENDACND